MNPRILRLVFPLIAAGALSGCGGGSSDPVVLPDCARFEPAGTPDRNTVIARQTAQSTCEVLVIELAVTEIDDVFSAAFTVSFDPLLFRFDGLSTEESFLGEDGTTLIALVTEDDGTVVVAVARAESPGAYAVGTERLLTLTLARRAAEGTSTLSLDATQLRDSSGQAIPDVTWFGGTLVTN